jgi:cell wall-associated NlpC family hydrolase
VLSTLAVTGGSASAAAAELPAETTVELPTVTEALAGAVAQSSAATELAALDYAQQAELQERRDRAADKARKTAKRAKAEAEREAAARKAKKAAERKRASRTASPAKGSVATVLGFFRAQLGKPYVLGATGPSAYDCSGLTQAAFRTIGIELPRVSQDQSTTGTPVSLDALKPGDLLFWGGVGSAYHVAVYVGDGMYIDAANPGKGVVQQKLSDYPPTSARRVL